MRDLLKISVKASRVRPIIALLGLTVAAAALSYVSAEDFNSRGTPLFRVSSPLRAGQSSSMRVRIPALGIRRRRPSRQARPRRQSLSHAGGNHQDRTECITEFMGLEKYVKLTTAAKKCGMDERTLLSRLEKMGYVVPSNSHHRPIMVREVGP